MIMFHHHRWHLILVHLVPQRPGQRLLQIEKQPEDRHVNEFQFWDRQDEKEIEGDAGGFSVVKELHGVGQLEWVSFEVVMVSGAAESVAPENMAAWMPIKEPDGSPAGRKYISASGEVLQVPVHTNEVVEATFQVADDRRPLCSIARVCDQSNTVVFTSVGGKIKNGHGQRTI